MSGLHSIYSTLLVMQQPLLKHLKEMGKNILIVVEVFFVRKSITQELHHDTLKRCSTMLSVLHFPTNGRTLIQKHMSTYRERQACICAAMYLNVYTKSYTRKPGEAFDAFQNVSDKHYRQIHSLKICDLFSVPLERGVIQKYLSAYGTY